MMTALTVAYIFFMVGPAWESRFHPVLDKLKIERVNGLNEEQSEIFVAFRKRRDCDYVGMAWYRNNGDAGLERVAIVQFRAPGDTSSPNRPVGLQSAGPWHVSIPPADILTKSVVETLHRCHPFWITRTPWYP